MKWNVLTLSLGLAIDLLFLARAQTVPPLINYQGQLTGANGTNLPTADYELRFSIYDAATGTNLIWGPQVFNGQSGPGYGPKIPVVQGYFNVMLGPVDTNSNSLLNAFNATNRYVDIKVGTNNPISPRQQILSAPYALKAAHADSATVVDNAVTTSNMTIFVSTNGSDANDGFSTNQAKRTIQAAVNLVPDRIAHVVEIQVCPGVYHEQVKVINKTLLGQYTTPAPLFTIKGMGTAPTNQDEIVITPDRTSPYAFYVEHSTVDIFKLTFSPGPTVYCGNSSFMTANLCNFYSLDNVGDNVVVQCYSRASFADCLFKGKGLNPSWGLRVLESASAYLVRNNTFDSFSLGIRAQDGRVIMLDALPTFLNVQENTHSYWGGYVYPP